MKKDGGTKNALFVFNSEKNGRHKEECFYYYVKMFFVLKSKQGK